MFRIRPRATVLALVLAALLAGTAACKGKGPGPAGDLPAGDGLLKESATAMRGVQTVNFAIEADGTVSGIALRRAGGTLTRDGKAKGSAQVEQFGTNVELQFVVVGDSIYLKGATGGYQKIPLELASSVYDPSAILDPDRGVAKLLDTATEARSEGREKVNGTDSYRVSAKLEREALSAIVPGVTEDTPGQLWIATDSKRLLKAKVGVPGEGGKTTNVTVTFTDFDKPADISVPS